jgi:putative flippase GtrA
MTPFLRFLRFNLTGGLGIGVQVGVLWLLGHALGVGYLPATAVAVSAAVLHNFVWHWRWTWRDREIPVTAAGAALARFALANGAVSLAGNLIVMSVLVGVCGVAPLPANLLAIAACGLLNFWLGDRVVFAAAATRSGAPSADRRATPARRGRWRRAARRRARRWWPR